MRSYNQKKKNNIIIGSLLGVILLMTVGYAVFNSVLNIKGTSGISSNWDVRITNVVSKNIVGGATNAKEPTFEALTASMEVNLEEPKDSIEYDITVTNNGTIDAKLDKINLTDSNNPAIKFTTSGLTEGTKLKVGESAVLTLKVEYLDGVSVDPNNMSSTLTVTLEYSQSNINNEGIAVPEGPTASEQLTENIVTTGDGLYEDTTEAGRYIYRGSNPDNYITFNNERWRIISVESDGTLKIKRHATVKQVWDSNGRRAATASASYCTSKTFGCNVWGSSTTMLNNNLENVTTMPIQINGEVYDLPKSESDINSYLNRTYYGTLDDEVKSQIDNHLWNVGLLGTTSGQTLETDVAQEKAYKWRGNIGLVNVSDYVRANSNMEKCGTKALLQNNVETCKKTNYMYSGVDSWTMSPMTGGSVWIMNSAGYLSGNGAAYSDVIQPVLYLIPDISLDGEGTAINPYTIVS